MFSPTHASILFVGGFLTLVGCRSPALGPTAPSGYRVTLPAASQTTRRHPLPITVCITDVHGMPVDEVPVSFRIPQRWMASATVTPATVMTRHGRATTTFRARSAGRIPVEITVEDLAQTIYVAVVGETPRF